MATSANGARTIHERAAGRGGASGGASRRGDPMKLWAWGQSDPGRKRERNEDSYLVDPDTGILAVADGMGGHQGGATASRMAVELMAKELGDARGDFEAALERTRFSSVRVTEEMPAVEDGSTADV